MSEGITENGSWDEDFKSAEEKANDTNSNQDQKRLQWMKFDKPGEYRIRLFGKFVKFHRWWSPFTTRVITHVDYKSEDPAWNAGFWPRKTFAIHIIDRGDTDEEHPTGKLKILEKGSTIFEEFAKYKRVNKVDPSSRNGVDFVIEVKWPQGNKRSAKYSVTPVMQVSKLTEQEVAMIKSEYADLKKIYGPTPLDKIKELWDSLPEESKIPPEKDEKSGTKAPVQAAAPVQAPVQAAQPVPVETVSVPEDDDLFGDSDDSTGF